MLNLIKINKDEEKNNESENDISSNESKDIILEYRENTIISTKNIKGIYNSPLSKRRRRSSIINLINTLSPEKKINPNTIKLIDSRDHKNKRINSPFKKKKNQIINIPSLNTFEKEIEHLCFLFNNYPLFKETPDNLFPYVKYILERQILKEENLIILKNYLTQFPGLINIIKIKKATDIDNIINKIAFCLNIEKINKNRIICLNGEIGDKFYLIFKGIVAILVPEEYEYELNEEEYLSHLMNLRELNEYDILIRTIESNNKIMSSEKIISIASENFHFSNLIKDNEINLDDYLKNILPKIDENTLKNNKKKYKNHPKKKITLWKYHKVCELTIGNTFGDIALSKYYNHRTATVISLQNCYFGILNKENYDNCIKNLQEKCRKDEIEMLLSNNIFNGIDPISFEKNYYNYFTKIKLKRQEILFENGEDFYNYYFVFKGEIEIESYLSLYNLNYISKKLSGKNNINEENLIRKINLRYPEMNIFYHKNKLVRLIILKNEGIIGMNNIIIDGKYFCRGIVKSVSCELFCIEKKFFDKILRDERKIERSFIKKQNENLNLMIDRLEYLRKNNFQNHYQKTLFNNEIKEEPNEKNNNYSNSNKLYDTFLSEKNIRIPSLKKTFYNIKSLNHKKKHNKTHNSRNKNYSRINTYKTNIDNFGLTYQLSERDNNSLSTFSNNNHKNFPNINKRVLSNDKINLRIKNKEIEKEKNNNLLYIEKKNIPVPSLLTKTFQIKNKVINELIKHSKNIQSHSPLTSRNKVFDSKYEYNNIDFLALDKYIQNYEKTPILFSPSMKGKKFIKRKIKKRENI